MGGSTYVLCIQGPAGSLPPDWLQEQIRASPPPPLFCSLFLTSRIGTPLRKGGGGKQGERERRGKKRINWLAAGSPPPVRTRAPAPAIAFPKQRQLCTSSRQAKAPPPPTSSPAPLLQDRPDWGAGGGGGQGRDEPAPPSLPGAPPPPPGAPACLPACMQMTRGVEGKFGRFAKGSEAGVGRGGRRSEHLHCISHRRQKSGGGAFLLLLLLPAWLQM